MPDVTRTVLSRRHAEIGFATATALLGAIVMWGAAEHDIGWTRSGPEAGYFPFRIGLVLFVVSVTIAIVQTVRSPRGALLTPPDARELARFVLPLGAFAILVPPLGLYLAGALYLAVAIGWIGRMSWRVALSIAGLAPVVIFVVFEFVFVVPLPKGPLGPLLGML